jgi:NADPH-dependent 2,4-dienoyl-CoA reductase/sulfur reductase-like enzyme
VGVDLNRCRLQLSDGAELSYDGLVVATGARARTLPESGSNVWTLRTIEDAIGLRSALTCARTVVVIGGGPLAMEVAYAANRRGVSATIVCRTMPMLRQVGSEIAEMIVSEATAAGVDVMTAAAPASLRLMEDGTSIVVTRSGDELTADVIVTAIGCAPNTEWLNGCGLPVEPDGLVVDECLYASENVVGAGDAVTIWNAPRTPLWSNAVEQSMLAATNLASEQAGRFTGKPYFCTEVFGRRVKVVGAIPDDAPASIDRHGEGTLYSWVNRERIVEAVAALDTPLSVGKLRRRVGVPLADLHTEGISRTLRRSRDRPASSVCVTSKGAQR